VHVYSQNSYNRHWIAGVTATSIQCRATWRRFFDTKEDEFNDAAEIVDSSVEEVALDNRAEVSVPKHAPIQSETAKRARKEFIMELRRNSSSNSANVISVSSDISGNVGVTRDESDIMNRPNLEIPIRPGVQCNIAQ
jgi:hypothetical protein